MVALAVVALGASAPSCRGRSRRLDAAGAGTAGQGGRRAAQQDGQGAPGAHEPSRDRSDVPPPPTAGVEAVPGLRGVDHFSTDSVPAWAQEYGNHGPVALAPDGRLWVAPDAEVLQTVVAPLAGSDLAGSPVTASYAVEAVWDPPEDVRSDVAWVLIYTDGTSGAVGEMDEPGRWTRDFEIWVDDVTAQVQGRPSFDERLVQVADDTGPAGGGRARRAARPAGRRQRHARRGGALGRTDLVRRGAPRRRTLVPGLRAGGLRPDFASFLDWAAEEYA